MSVEKEIDRSGNGYLKTVFSDSAVYRCFPLPKETKHSTPFIVCLSVCVCVYMYVSFRDRYHLFQLLLIFVLLNIYYSVAQAR